jgi:hypothetical protein
MPVTFTENVHVVDGAASVAPERLMLVPPGVAVTVPPAHAPNGLSSLNPFGVAMTSPAGNESMKPTPVTSLSATIWNVRDVVSPTTIEEAPNDVLMEGGVCARAIVVYAPATSVLDAPRIVAKIENPRAL